MKVIEVMKVIKGMETLNYIGSKKTLFKTILNVCQENIPKITSFADLFAGTGTIGFNMKKIGIPVISNDLEYYSFVINSALLKCSYTDKMKRIIDELNLIPIMKGGLITESFSPSGKSQRMFFTTENAEKCDAIRTQLKVYLEKGKITKDEFFFLLASLLVSIDKVANTSSVYGAYLKQFKKSALQELILKPIHTERMKEGDMKGEDMKENEVFNQKIEDLVLQREFDVVYLDPPYNQRQYGGNYSPLNTIAFYDETLELQGKTGLLKNYNKSNFCSKVKVRETFEKLIQNCKCKVLILSYNNEGLLKFDVLKKILLQKGDVKLYNIKYAKFKAQKNVKEESVIEYLWVVKEGGQGNFEKVEMELVK